MREVGRTREEKTAKYNIIGQSMIQSDEERVAAKKTNIISGIIMIGRSGVEVLVRSVVSSYVSRWCWFF